MKQRFEKISKSTKLRIIFAKVNKIDRSLAKPLRKKRADSNKIINEKGSITNGITRIKQIMGLT